MFSPVVRNHRYLNSLLGGKSSGRKFTDIYGSHRWSARWINGTRGRLVNDAAFDFGDRVTSALCH